MQRRTFIASVGAIMGTGIGATAYTSATVNRDATIEVATDDSALVALKAGTFDQITQNGDGLLNINFTQLNSNSEFIFGDSESADTAYAFSLTPTETHDITLNYEFSGTGSDPDGDVLEGEPIPNVKFDFLRPNADNTGFESQTVASENSAGLIQNVVTEPYYVVLTIDTTDVNTNTADLSGTLTITSA